MGRRAGCGMAKKVIKKAFFMKSTSIRYFPMLDPFKSIFYLFWLSVAEHCDEHSQTYGVLPQQCACWQGNFAFREGFRYDLLCEPFKWCPCPMTRFVNKTITWPDVNLSGKWSFSLNDWATRRGVSFADQKSCWWWGNVPTKIFLSYQIKTRFSSSQPSRMSRL